MTGKFLGGDSLLSLATEGVVPLEVGVAIMVGGEMLFRYSEGLMSVWSDSVLLGNLGGTNGNAGVAPVLPPPPVSSS
jgi:hypothetical protein